MLRGCVICVRLFKEGEKKKSKKGKKELTPEEIAAAAEEERLLIKSFYLQKWDEVKKKTALYNLWLDEGYPGAEYQPPLNETDFHPVLFGVAKEEIAPFEKVMAPLLLCPEYWREDVKNYTAAALRYADWLNQKANSMLLDLCSLPLPAHNMPRLKT